MKKYDAARCREHMLIRNRVGIADFTMGLIEVTGADAEVFLNGLSVNDLRKSGPGRVMYTCMLDENAQYVDDVTIYCFSKEKYWVITAFKDNTILWFEAHRGSMAVKFEDLSDKIALWSIQGPDSRRLLTSCMAKDMTSMKYYHFMENEVSGVPIILSRTGFTGELGYEIFADNTRIDRIVADLVRLGRPYGAQVITTDVGLESLPTEKGLITIRDFRNTNPLEMGMDALIKWDKGDFVGKARLEEIRKSGPARLLMGFVAEDDEIDIELESPVKVGKEVVGKVTTANYGYSVELSIGYCLIDSKYAKPGQKLTIVSNGTEVGATVCERVFYDKARVRVNAKAEEVSFTDGSTRLYLDGGREKVFRGVFGAMPTSMTRDEALDEAAIAKMVDHMAQSGLDGILVGGSSGEYPALSLEERKELMRIAVEAAAGRIKIAACCSTNTTRTTKELCSYAGEVGVDFVLLMTPFDPSVSEADAVAFYKEMAAFSKPGVVIYHYPAYTGVALSADAIAELAHERNIVGIKNVADLTSTVEIINRTQGEAFGVLTGTDEMFLGALASGGDGFMGVCGCVAPGICRKLYDSFQEGDMKTALDMHKRICKIMAVVFGGPFPGTLKTAMEIQGLACGRPRKPCAPTDLVNRRTLQSVLAETGVIGK